MFGTVPTSAWRSRSSHRHPDINLATADPSRTFPDLAQVVADNTNAETGTLPGGPCGARCGAGARRSTATRSSCPTALYANNILTAGELNFRLSARDQKPVGGGYAFDDLTLTLDPAAGPFLVTSRGTAGSPVSSGATETVTWDVAGTAGAALAPNVKISLSTDGGQTFPTELDASTRPTTAARR